MTATNPETPPTAPVAATAPAAAPAQDATDWKAEARKWEKLAKDNSNAAKRLTEIEEASKTELQKAQERADAAEKRVAEFESRDQRAKWAADIVKDSKVPASALRGATEDELKAHFEELKALIPAEEAPKPKPGAVGPYVPTEGSNPTGTLGGPRQEFANFLSGQLSR